MNNDQLAASLRMDILSLRQEVRRELANLPKASAIADAVVQRQDRYQLLDDFAQRLAQMLPDMLGEAVADPFDSLDMPKACDIADEVVGKLLEDLLQQLKRDLPDLVHQVFVEELPNRPTAAMVRIDWKKSLAILNRILKDPCSIYERYARVNEWFEDSRRKADGS